MVVVAVMVREEREGRRNWMDGCVRLWWKGRGKRCFYGGVGGDEYIQKGSLEMCCVVKMMREGDVGSDDDSENDGGVVGVIHGDGDAGVTVCVWSGLKGCGCDNKAEGVLSLLLYQFLFQLLVLLFLLLTIWLLLILLLRCYEGFC